MELSLLFRRNAELCAEMASATKSIDVREQWMELAKQWRQKAEADEPLAPKPINSAAPVLVNISPAYELAERSRDDELEHGHTLASKLVPPKTPLLRTENLSQDQPQEYPDELAGGGEPDDEWNKLLADIRAK